MGTTRRSTLALVALGALVLTWGALRILDGRGTYLSPVPWLVGPALLVLAAGVLWAASTVRAYLKGRRPSLDALRAARTAALAKAASLTGALLSGWYAGQVALTLSHLDIEAQQHRAWSAGAAALCAVLLAVAGLVSEHFCRIPPPEDGHGAAIGEDGAHD